MGFGQSGVAEMMAGAQALKKRANRAGFTLIEVAVVVSIVAITAGLLLDRVLFYQEQAEKAAMEHTVGIIRSALHLQVASLMAKNRTNELSGLVDKNPMEWLAETPKNYIGAYFAPNSLDLTTGSWYFDLQNRNLVYLVKGKNHFQNSEAGSNRIRFQVRLVGSKQVQEAQSAPNVEGVILDQLVPYTWF
jgi:prepilin-type N-terminal cleavage/methylation domain-containing protein